MKKNGRYVLGAAVVAALAITAGYFALREAKPPPDGPGPQVEQPEPIPSPPPIRWSPASLAEGSQFLYTGNNPRQIGVKPGTIEPRRAAVLRGLVQTREEKPAPLAGVRVTVLNHPEYGSTTTQADGTFDLVVNGGGPLTVGYQKEGLLPAVRHVNVPWQDYTWLPDVALIPLDEKVTAIDLKAGDAIQVARGSRVKDKDGERQATVLFPRGTEATMFLPDGSKKALTNLKVRITEYTVGPRGPAAMPAPLPPTSAYTYACELTVDEVREKGGKDLVFNKPVPFYVDNFLKFPAGTLVPAGYFDNDKGAWIPSDNGRVIKVLSVAGGLAELDVDGKGQAAEAKALAALGIENDERKTLAGLYKSGQSLWRIPLPHFSRYDFNWGVGAPLGATDPPLQVPVDDLPTQNPLRDCGSVIDVHNQALGESVGVAGTPYRLHFQSERTHGRHYQYGTPIRLSANTIPKSLKRIELAIEIAGHRFIQHYPPKPNLSHPFRWDGKDVYGRLTAGQRIGTVRVGYTYDAVYSETRQFGYSGTGVPITGDWARQEVTFWREHQITLGGYDAREQGLAGWSLNTHHKYDPVHRHLYLGDGRWRSGHSVSQMITTIAGTGRNDYSGDGGPAPKAELGGVTGLVFGPDGSLFFSDWSSGTIRRIAPGGTITTVAGTGKRGTSGLGGPATKAQLYSPSSLAVGPDGSLYFRYDLHRLARVWPDGKITIVAGGGKKKPVDGVLAIDANLSSMLSAVVGQDGSLYISQLEGWVYAVDPSGRLRVIVAGGTEHVERGAALKANLGHAPRISTIGRDGSLYVIAGSRYPPGNPTENNHVRRITPDGVITTVAGGGKVPTRDGLVATEAQMNPSDVAVAADGTLFVLDYSRGLLHRIGSDGKLVRIAGTEYGKPGNPAQAPDALGDGGPALLASLSSPAVIAIAADHSLVIADYQHFRIRRIASPFPGISSKELTVPDEAGSQLYVFDQSGRHLRTINALTGAVIDRFDYDNNGRLKALHDRDGNATRIERDANGHPTALVAPHGQRTALGVDANGYLASITNPAQEKYELAYGKGGLLTALKDPRGNSSRFTYDDRGRLTKDEGPGGGFVALERSKLPNGFVVAATTGLRPPTTYRVERLPTGEENRLNTCCCGAETKIKIAADRTRTIVSPDGTVSILTEQPDPRWGLQAPLLKSYTQTTPGGIKSTFALERKVELAKPGELLSLKSLTDTFTVNGRKYTTTHDTAGKQITQTTPSGRKVVTTLDERGRVIRTEAPGLHPVRYQYDRRGRLTKMMQGSGAEERVVTLEYDGQGNLASFTGPLQRTTRFEYDPAGRATKQVLPDKREIVFAFDANGNLKSLTPPGKLAHAFDYTPGDLTKAYQPPKIAEGSTDTGYVYNQDKKLTRINRPDGKTVELAYDKVGHLKTVTAAGTKLAIDFDGKTEQLKSLTTAEGNTLSYAYDGPLLTKTAWAGTIKGSVERRYDVDHRLASISVNGANPVAYKYDADGLMIQAGAMTMERDPKTGLLTGTRLGKVTTKEEHTAFGERKRFAVAFDGKELFVVAYERDNLGRITKKVETVEGKTDTYTYGYDAAGRLTDVTKNGVKSGHYEYDSNGNRLAYKGQRGSFKGTYDAQDRLLTYGGATYEHTAHGEWRSKSEGGKTTTYEYDVLGNLRAVGLPDGRKIEYVIDGANRRVGKQVNGKLVQGLLYQDRLMPIAELDGANNLVCRFVYGTEENVPVYMERAGKTNRIITDHLGSPRLVIDLASGQVAQRMDYDAFGNVLDDTRPGWQPFGFGGGLFEPHSLLVRLGERDYSPHSGRWGSRDPILFGDSTNLYGYVDNDPVNYVDPTGLAKKPCPKPTDDPNNKPTPRPTPDWDELKRNQEEYRKQHPPLPSPPPPEKSWRTKLVRAILYFPKSHPLHEPWPWPLPW